MSKKASVIAAAALLALPGLPAFAQSVSGNVTLSSDYVFRGVTQTDGDPAIQAGIDLDEGAFYAGAWVSNVDFGDDTDFELDLYAGWAPQWQGTAFDLGVIVYTYPGATDAAGDQDFIELHAGTARSYGPVTVDAGLYWTPDFYLEAGAAHYVDAGASWAFSDTVSIDLRAGYSRFDDNSSANYTDYQLGMTASHLGLDWDVRWHDSEIDEGRLVLSVGRSFGG